MGSKLDAVLIYASSQNNPTFFHLDGINQITTKTIDQINLQYVTIIRYQNRASTLNQVV